MSRGRVPIGDYGLVGDTRTAALVAPDGSIDWCCLPRFDSPPVFGRLVGGEDAGCFAVGPAEPTQPMRRRYVDSTTTVETTWAVDGGELRLADSMVAEVSGRFLPGTLLIRRLEATGSGVSFEVLGPAPAPLARLRGEHRVQFFLKGRQRALMRDALRKVLADVPEARKRVTVDVDPLNVL